MKIKSGNPNLMLEAVMSLLHWVLVFVMINNAFWVAMYFSPTRSPSNTQIEMVQDGTGNNQSITSSAS